MEFDTITYDVVAIKDAFASKEPVPTTIRRTNYRFYVYILSV